LHKYPACEASSNKRLGCDVNKSAVLSIRNKRNNPPIQRAV
jgi:hypothetical protein